MRIMTAKPNRSNALPCVMAATVSAMTGRVPGSGEPGSASCAKVAGR
jgi:hypothetical protein